MNDCDDIVKEFLVESHENLDRLDRDLVELEKHPSDRETLASIFRTIHTIKGTSGFLGFGRLESVTHAGESLLARLRDGQLSLNPELTTGLLAMVDAVRQMLAEIQATGQDGNADHSGLVANLTRLQQGSDAAAAPPVPQAAAGAIKQVEPPAEDRARTQAQEQEQEQVRPAKPTKARTQTKTAKTGKEDGTQAENAGRAKEKGAAGTAVTGERAQEPAVVDLLAGERGSSEHADGEQGSGASEAKMAEARPPEAAHESIRVDVGLLDRLMNLVGELVLARNQILQFTKTTEEMSLVTAGQRLNLIASELQESVMKTRMQPIGSVWSRFPRTVRDVALACGKQVRIQMEGQETELDKTLIEAIKDPMTHLVRNAVDHGIENPDGRRAAGKDPEGVLLLRAYHEGGQVNIEISDDGAGLNLEANLAFLPGLSTAEKVTNVSGRGVGMDVVKTNIERIGGTVDLQSTPGKGTTVKVKIPLTLAIVPALIVKSAGERYAIPQVSLLELVGLDGEEARKGVEMIHGVPVYRLRGRLLPLVHLKHTLQTADAAASADGFERVNIVVLQAEGQRFGLVVDEISDTEEIVVKPLGRHLKNISVYAGATIMGDGKVALILDVLGLAQSSSIVAEAHERALSEQEQAKGAGGDRQKLVLFAGRADSRMAVPLSMLARLENIPGSEVERSGNQWVTQYRGQILRLIRVSHALAERRNVLRAEDVITLPTTAALQVLVLENQGQTFGLVVNQILDIVESASEPQSPSTRAGVLYSSVIADRVTELLDVPAILSAGEAYEPVEAAMAGS
jgi:two-component system, chemotaxis family, sensor kinase CheA